MDQVSSDEVAVETATGLIEEAKRYVQAGCPRMALWRLVDAAGLLSGVLDDPQADGNVPTGRGFYIVKGNGGESSCPALYDRHDNMISVGDEVVICDVSPDNHLGWGQIDRMQPDQNTVTVQIKGGELAGSVLTVNAGLTERLKSQGEKMK